MTRFNDRLRRLERGYMSALDEPVTFRIAGQPGATTWYMPAAVARRLPVRFTLRIGDGGDDGEGDAEAP